MGINSRRPFPPADAGAQEAARSIRVPGRHLRRSQRPPSRKTWSCGRAPLPPLLPQRKGTRGSLLAVPGALRAQRGLGRCSGRCPGSGRTPQARGSPPAARRGGGC